MAECVVGGALNLHILVPPKIRVLGRFPKQCRSFLRHFRKMGGSGMNLAS